ncbi:MAG: NIPSNAP family protein [Hyphomicrobiales bacterium]
MIVEMRTYTMNVGKTAIWLENFAKHGLPIQDKHLGKLIAVFTSETGTLNQVVHMRAYESFADRETRRAAMMQDPEWMNFLKSEPPGLVANQQSQILRPTAFSPLK